MLAKQAIYVLYVQRKCDLASRGVIFRNGTLAERFRIRAIRAGYANVSRVRQLREVA